MDPVLGIIRSLFKAMEPKEVSRFSSTPAQLTPEEAALLEEYHLRHDAMKCVKCGRRTSFAVDVRIQKEVRSEQKGFFLFFNRQDITYYDKRTLAIPLCWRHRLGLAFVRLVEKGIFLLAIPSSAVVTFYSRAWICHELKLHMETDDWLLIAGVFIFWGIVFLVVLGCLAEISQSLILDGLWNYSPLKQLRRLGWAPRE